MDNYMDNDVVEIVDGFLDIDENIEQILTCKPIVLTKSINSHKQDHFVEQNTGEYLEYIDLSTSVNSNFIVENVGVLNTDENIVEVIGSEYIDPATSTDCEEEKIIEANCEGFSTIDENVEEIYDNNSIIYVTSNDNINSSNEIENTCYVQYVEELVQTNDNGGEFFDDDSIVPIRVMNFNRESFIEETNEDFLSKDTSNIFVPVHKEHNYFKTLMNNDSLKKKDVRYKCSVCTATFGQKYTLMRHFKSNHILEIYNCPICEIQISQLDNLKTHIKMVHDNIRRFECSVCHMRFKKKEHLHKHMERIHKILQPKSLKV